MTLARLAAALAVASAAVAGCGLADTAVPRLPVTLSVTTGFGRQVLRSASERAPRPGETALRLLERTGRVGVAADGAVASLDGVRARWRYWVNGVAPATRPGDYALRRGDAIQFDAGGAGAPPTAAIVGAFPQPFADGLMGRRLPTRIECGASSDSACATVRGRLERVGALPSGAPIGAPAGADTIRIVVGRWQELRQLEAAKAIVAGPAQSGVYVRPDDAHQTFDLLTATGVTRARAPAGAGLVAAVSLRGEALVWIVSGFDDAGVARAAAALDSSSLHAAFAVVASPAAATRLPLAG